MSNDAQAPDATVEPQKCCGNCRFRLRIYDPTPRVSMKTVGDVCGCRAAGSYLLRVEKTHVCVEFAGGDGNAK